MRQPLPFDTHSYVKRLAAAGMPEAQDEVQAEALAEFVLSQVATKEDLRRVRDELTQKIEHTAEQLEARLNHRIDAVELRLSTKLESELRKQLVWFFGMLLV
jgi:hypothetical protein